MRSFVAQLLNALLFRLRQHQHLLRPHRKLVLGQLRHLVIVCLNLEALLCLLDDRWFSPLFWQLELEFAIFLRVFNCFLRHGIGFVLFDASLLLLKVLDKAVYIHTGCLLFVLEELLGVTPDLRATSRCDASFHHLPVATVSFEHYKNH